MASLDEFSREQVILSALRTTGRVAVTDLAARFGVSSVTVRKDLDALERRSLLRRVRGGAVSLGASDEGSFEARFTDSRDRKQAIAKAAAAAVRDGDVIAIDSSTTAFYLAQEIVERRGLVVVTNGLRLATLLMEQSSARVLVLGGVLRRSAGSLVGPIGDVLSSRGRITKGFFGLVGLSTVHGLMDISAEEAQTKHVMAAACDEVHGLFDSTKITGFGLHPFAATERVTGLWTDDEAPAEFVTEWRDRGVAVHTAAFRHRTADVRPARAAPRRNTVITRSSPVRTPFPDKGVSMRPARKLSALVALGAAAALALTGCTKKNQADTGAASGGAGASAAATTYKVAFVPKLQGVPYFEAMNAGGQKAAAALGNVEWLYQGPTQADAAAQADIVRSYIQQKVNTLIVAPNDPDSMAPLLQQAKDAGIHVATADTDAPSSVREAFVNQATAEGIGQGLTDSLLKAMGGRASTRSSPAARRPRT